MQKTIAIMMAIRMIPPSIPPTIAAVGAPCPAVYSCFISGVVVGVIANVEDTPEIGINDPKSVVEAIMLETVDGADVTAADLVLSVFVVNGPRVEATEC